MTECPGLYVHARAADGLLARIRLPGGRLDAAAARGLARAARELGNGVIDLTNRANLQIRGLDAATAARLPAMLAAFGLDPGPAADRRRNILADPLAGLDPAEALDVSPLVAELDAALASAALAGLSPKFSFALDGGGRSASLAFPHDAGVRAERTQDGVVLRLSLAGRPTRFGLPPEAAATALVAIAAATARRGARARARDLEGLSEAAIGASLVALPEGAPAPEPPSFIGRAGAAFGLGTPAGAIDGDALEALADLAAAFGDAALRLTPRRSVLITGVKPGAIAALEREAQKLGFLVRPPAVAVVACSGLACARGRADARRDGAALAQALADLALRRLVHVSGCPRGCAHPGAADLAAVARQDGFYDLHRSAKADISAKPAVARLSPARLGEAVRGLIAEGAGA